MRALSLMEFVEYDTAGAVRLLNGLFVIGLAFSAATVPPSVETLRRCEEGAVVEAGDGDMGVLATAHWLLLRAFVAVQVVQVPFRVAALAQVLRLGWFARDAARREAVVASFRKAVANTPWKVNQSLGCVAQYVIPFTGFFLLVVFGESSGCATGETADHETPSSAWVRLVFFVFVRVVLTFAWGFFASAADFPTTLSSTGRGASPAMLEDLLETLTLEPETDLPMSRCTVCISDFAHGDALAILPCNRKHVFHAACVSTWLKRSKACPLCMVDIDDPLHWRKVR